MTTNEKREHRKQRQYKHRSDRNKLFELLHSHSLPMFQLCKPFLLTRFTLGCFLNRSEECTNLQLFFTTHPDSLNKCCGKFPENELFIAKRRVKSVLNAISFAIVLNRLLKKPKVHDCRCKCTQLSILIQFCKEIQAFYKTHLFCKKPLNALTFEQYVETSHLFGYSLMTWYMVTLRVMFSYLTGL